MNWRIKYARDFFKGNNYHSFILIFQDAHFRHCPQRFMKGNKEYVCVNVFRGGLLWDVNHGTIPAIIKANIFYINLSQLSSSYLNQSVSYGRILDKLLLTSQMNFQRPLFGWLGWVETTLNVKSIDVPISDNQFFNLVC